MGHNEKAGSPDLDWRDYIICDSGVLGGKPTLKGTRLSVEFVLEVLAGGWDGEAIRRNYPNLTDNYLSAVKSYAKRDTAQGSYY